MSFLFMKERHPPLTLLTLDVCISRLKEGHPLLGTLRSNAAKYQRGYNGERKLDHHLKSLDRTFNILSDVTLSVFGRQFQIDSLIVTAHAIYIIEVKNLRGTVTFHTGLKQLIQDDGEILIGRKHPIVQVENITFLFSRWLQLNKLDGLPIYYYVAIADPATIVQVNGDEQSIAKTVSYAEEIPIKLVKMNARFEQANPANHPLKNKIIQTVLEKSEELQIDILEKLSVNKHDILPGVHCPECGKLGMLRRRYIWYYPQCHAKSRTAHKKALLDFALIYKKEITNSECQQFLKVGNKTAYSILKNVEGVSVHASKKKWLLDIDILRKHTFNYYH